MSIQFAPKWNSSDNAFTCILANVADSGSATNSTLLDLQVNSVSKFTVGKFGELVIAPTARTSGSDSLINLIAPADTTRAAGTPAPDITIGLNRTVEFASNTTITNQRAIVIERPTYTFALPNGRINTPSTVHIAGEPLMGPNWIFNDQRYALSIGSGTVRFWAAGQLNPAFQLGSYAWGPFLYNNGWTWSGVAGGLMRMSPAGGILVSNSLYFGFTDNGFTDTPSAGFFQDATGIIAQRNSTNSQIFRLYNTFTDSSNYERLALQFGTYSSVRHARIAAESAGTGTANINLVLTPRGTGAFILGPPPDGTATGGNVRGANAVDLCTSRSSATQVASGSQSFVAPCGGTASGNGSISLSGIASGQNSISHGSVGNTTASGALSVVFCSDYTGASGPRSFACCGDFLNVTGQFAFGHGTIPGFGGATVAGNGSFGVAGGGTTSDGIGALAHGPSAVSRLRGMRAFASGRFAANGDAQGVDIVLRNTTTTDSAVTLFVNGTSELLTIPSGKVCQFLLIITGVRDGGADVSVYMRRVTIKNIGGTTALVGAVDTIGTDQATGTSIAITADNTNDALQIAPTGVSGQTWRWECVVYGGEIGHG